MLKIVMDIVMFILYNEDIEVELKTTKQKTKAVTKS